MAGIDESGYKRAATCPRRSTLPDVTLPGPEHELPEHGQTGAAKVRDLPGDSD